MNLDGLDNKLEHRSRGWLAGYRALDLTDENGNMCGWVLGSLGVDVIKIEKPGGDLSRRIGPFYRDCPDSQKSLSWFAYNSNKRGITLNLESADGKVLFLRLVEKADFVLESFHPGYLDGKGLGYQSLSQTNPGIIMVSISPFGQYGPYRHYRGADIVASALSGLLYVYGTPEKPPVKISAPMAYPVAATDGAVGALIALQYRGASGEGQHVDVSAQHSLESCTLNLIPVWTMNRKILRRAGEYRGGLAGQIKQRQLWHCRDGEVIFLMLGGRYGARVNSSLVEWMAAEGMADKFLLQIDWGAFDPRVTTQADIEKIEEPIGKFFQKHTRQELYEGSVARDLQICPVSSPKDIRESTQLKAREFWTDVEHDDLGVSISYPGPFAQATDKCCDVWFRAPLVGEHNREIFEYELGLSKEEILCLKQGGVI